jgi:predicted nucleic acid-binding protein
VKKSSKKRDVLTRPKIRERNPEVNGERVGAFIKRLSEKAMRVEDVQQHFSYSRDPKDEKYLNLAVEV